MHLCQNPRQRRVPIVDPRMGVPCPVCAIDVRCEQGLAAQMQADHVRRQLRHRIVVLRQVVDEQRAGRRVFIEDRLQRRTLRPLIGEHPRVDPDIGELLRAHISAMIVEVGQDHHVGVLADRVDTGDGTRDRLLAVHLGIEEPVEQAPDLVHRHRAAILGIAQSVGEIGIVHAEGHAFLFREPVAEGGDHVQQHLVAIADDQRTAHPKSFRAAIMTAGDISSAKAAFTRSAS